MKKLVVCFCVLSFIQVGCSDAFYNGVKDSDKAVRKNFVESLRRNNTKSNVGADEGKCKIGIQFFYRKGKATEDTLFSSVNCLVDKNGSWVDIVPGKFMLYNKKGYKLKRKYLCKNKDENAKVCYWNGELRDGLVLSARLFSVDSSKEQPGDFFDIVSFYYNGDVYRQATTSICKGGGQCEINLASFIKASGKYPAYSGWRLAFFNYGEDTVKELAAERMLYNAQLSSKKTRGALLVNKIKKSVPMVLKDYDKSLYDDLSCYVEVSKGAYGNSLTDAPPKACAEASLSKVYKENLSYWKKGDPGAKLTEIKKMDQRVQNIYVKVKSDLIESLDKLDASIVNFPALKDQKELILKKIKAQTDQTWRADLKSLSKELEQLIKGVNDPNAKVLQDALKVVHGKLQNVIVVVDYMQNVDQLYVLSGEIYSISEKKAKLLIKSKKEKYKLALAIVGATVPNQKDAFLERKANPLPTGLEEKYFDGMYVDKVQSYYGIAWNAIPVSPFNSQIVSTVGIENAIPIIDLYGWRFQSNHSGIGALFNDVRLSFTGVTVLYEEFQNGDAIFNPTWIASFGLRSLRIGAGLSLFDSPHDEGNDSGPLGRRFRVTVGVDLFNLLTSKSTGVSQSENVSQSKN